MRNLTGIFTVSSTNLFPILAGVNFHFLSVSRLALSSTLKPLDSNTFISETFPFLSISA